MIQSNIHNHVLKRTMRRKMWIIMRRWCRAHLKQSRREVKPTSLIIFARQIMTTKRNREPHGAGRTRDKGQVKYYLAVCSLSERKTAITIKSVERERAVEKMKLKRSSSLFWRGTEISENDTRVHCIISSHPFSLLW